MKFLELIRWKNLLIIAATQFLIGFALLYPILNLDDIAPSLNILQFGLMVFTTVLIGAGGYLINDIFDQNIDKINKPDKVFIGKYLTEKQAYKIYALFGILGLLIMFFLSIQLDRWSVFLIYPIAWGLLWSYSHSFKKSPLFGNVIVGMFCAFVPGVLLVAEWPSISQIKPTSLSTQGLILFLIYILFAFLTNIIREIIKDMQDLPGDLDQGCRTLPIVWGINRTKGVILVFGAMLILSLGYFVANLGAQGYVFSFGWTSFAVLFPFGFFLFKLAKAIEVNQFAFLSKLMKFIMLGGLLLLIVFRIEVL